MFLVPVSLLFILLSVSAEPIHVSIRNNGPRQVDYGAAADALRAKYGYSPASQSRKRQSTAGIGIVDQVRRRFFVRCRGPELIVPF